MSDKSAIEWTDATWNPVTGCTKVSPGCDHCYAETFAERFRGVPGHHFEQGFDVTLRPERLDQPLRWKKPRRIFVNSMSDLFHKDVPDEYIALVLAVVASSPRHTYQLLTKRHGRMRSLLASESFVNSVADRVLNLDNAAGLPAPVELRERWWPLRNLWLGVSVEDQQRADLRIPALLDTPAAVRWISAEPLLGPVYLGVPLTPREDGSPRRDSALVVPCPKCDGWGTDCGVAGTHFVRRPTGLDWVVVGGESGHGARPMHPDWARSLRDQCTAAGVPFLFKQWGEHGLLPLRNTDPGVTVANDGTVYQPGDLSWPDGSRVGEALRANHGRAHLHAMYRVGKKAAGRELDGRTWDEYPAVPA